MMKYLCVFVAFCSVLTVQALTEEQELEEFTKACGASSGADQKLIADSFNGNFAEDVKLKEFFLCLSKKIGYQNEDGVLLKEVMRQKLLASLKDQKLVNSIIDECAIVRDTPQSTAFEATKCYFKKLPKPEAPSTTAAPVIPHVPARRTIKV